MQNSFNLPIVLCLFFWYLAVRAYRRLQIQSFLEHEKKEGLATQHSDWLVFIASLLAGFYFLGIADHLY